MFYTLKKVVNKALVAFVVVATLVFVFSWMGFSWMGSAIAIEISETSRTVVLNDAGEQITLSLEDFAIGQRQFNSSCAQCHIDGGSKTNPDVDLSTLTLANATPARDNIESIVDYLTYPTTYDGLGSLEELHPSISRSDLFPRMKDLTESDLSAIAGYILAEPKIVGDQWAGGKPKR
ncbi:MAG: cytochrome c-550 [Phormidesmis sp. RL_2_1]|nr:cytochrome c-550 [Phormidesmis sp. RL_2_1]